MSEQENYLISLLPENNSAYSKTNLSKLFKALHMMDFEPFHCAEQSTQDMTVEVLGARFTVNSVYTEFSIDGNGDITTTTSPTFTPPTGNPKIDLLYYDVATPGLGITPGAESATPSAPAIPDPAVKIPIALIYHRVGSTRILDNDDASNSYIMGRNVRPFLNIGGGASNTIDGISNPGGNIDFTSVDGSVTITPDDGADEIDFSVVVIPTGTPMLFKQSTAPTGWTIDDTITDKSAVRYTRGGSYGADAGSINLATGVSVTQGHALSVAELAAHTHTQRFRTGNAGSSDAFKDGSGSAVDGGTTLSTGSGNAHSHDIELRYTDVIVATKD